MVSDLDQPALCDAVTAEISSELGLASAIWSAADPSGERPVMTASGWVDAGGTLHHRPGGFELPGDGVELPVSYAGARLGTIVMAPRAGVGVSPDQRRVAVALADLLASALARGNAARALS
jgi:hypothetical protein